MESRESSSPVVTRAVAAALQDRYIDPYGLPLYQRVALRVLGAFPQAAALWLVPWASSVSALDPAVLARLQVEELVANRLQDYAALAGRFPVVIAGAAMGGAAAHLAVSVGAPFLPEAFVLTLRGGSPQGDTQTYFHRTAEAARDLTRREPGMITVQHFDPVHDGWLTRRVNHLRIKLVSLSEVYKSFLLDRLDPGGEVIYLEGQAPWPRYRIGERSFFQVGGWGAITPREFLDGSARLSAYARQIGLAHSHWSLSGYPLEDGPESEWGSEPGMGIALEQFCAQHGYRFTRIAFGNPHDFSRLAFRAGLLQLRKEGRAPVGVLVEMFSQYDATAVNRSGLTPLWLVFNTTDSLEYLRVMADEFPPDAPVFFSPLATYSLTPDMAPWVGWKDALRRFDWINIGTRSSHYPADARATVDWARNLRAWVENHNQPVQIKLTGADLRALAEQIIQGN